MGVADRATLCLYRCLASRASSGDLSKNSSGLVNRNNSPPDASGSWPAGRSTKANPHNNASSRVSHQ